MQFPAKGDFPGMGCDFWGELIAFFERGGLTAIPRGLTAISRSSTIE